MLDRLSSLLFDLYRGCREQPVDKYQDWAFERLKSAIPFDSGLWLTGILHADHTATIHSYACHNLAAQAMADWAKCEDRAVLTERVARSPGTAFRCVASEEFGSELLAHSRKYDIEYLLATTVVNPVSRLNEMISIYRNATRDSFSEEERWLQQNIVPHLAETWRINRVSHMNALSQPACMIDARTAIADKNGVLHLIEPGFIQLLQEEWSGWQGPVLPEGLMMQGTAAGDQRFTGKRLVISFMELEGFWLLRGRGKVLLDNLSKQERKVAEHFSAGRTYKEIAHAMNLAPSTVRNHLSSAYAKLGIADKAELTSLLIKNG